MTKTTFPLIFTSLLTLQACGFYPTPKIDEPVSHHRIVLDAGSSKTKLYFYQYDTQGKKSPQHIETLTENKQTPGLANIPLAQLNDYLSQLFTPTLAKQLQDLSKAQQDDAAHTLLEQIQVYSTAGMRLMSTVDRNEKNQAVSTWIAQWLTDNHIDFDNSHLDVRTITGAEEGAYAWAAFNYVEDDFTRQTSGILELGGASMQITYLDKQHTNITVSIGGQSYALASESHLLGQDLIAKKLSQFAACNLTGINDTAKGNYAVCHHQAVKLIENEPQLALPHATNIHRYGLLSNFYHTAQFYGLDKQYSLSQLEAKASQFCTLDWQTAQEQHAGINKTYLANYCLAGAYQAALLDEGYHLTDKQNFTPVNESHTLEVSWPIGLIITQDYQQRAPYVARQSENKAPAKA
ncbi:hypothetical protein [Shewanella surugensis]|uniref:GDA1/CD39 (Nucleoside phosphatase) family protein n=1 Tax=Shewanella surugensis TaxID=212020 RepID=A0ABT0L9D2_9GAMM|nr:hypothetical protein [Shewanella surugensis]MCL1124312.1 hypothetical protein [Shewanella surugensis]